ncbi:MAG TPA: PqqD family protein [Candidatus Acidoferrum sp.]|nr:PqqD family protein [Candidatus Acidoferrum sp.]
MKEREFPRARVDCLTRKFGDETLVYDQQRNVGHCLNSTAAAAWKLCDGKSSVSDLAKLLTRQLSAPVNEPVVVLALEELSHARLLVEDKPHARRTSRRDAIRTIGIAAAIALPIVTSLVAPTPARAASCLANGKPCVSGAQCCSGKCGTGGHCNT